MNFLLIGAVVLVLLGIAGVIGGGIQLHRRRRSWGWFVASGAAFAVALALAVASFASALWQGVLGTSGAKDVPCEQVAAFVDAAGLPAGLSDARCTYTGFQDSYYLMNGRVGRAEAAAWLGQFPGHPQLTTQDCATGATVCTAPIRFTPKANGGAEFATFEATELPDGRLQFTFTALNT